MTCYMRAIPQKRKTNWRLLLLLRTEKLLATAANSILMSHLSPGRTNPHTCEFVCDVFAIQLLYINNEISRLALQLQLLLMLCCCIYSFVSVFFSLLTCIAFMFPPRGMSLTSFAYQLERRHVRQKRTSLEFACVYKHTYTNVRIFIHVLNDSIYNIYPHHFTNDCLSVLPFSRSSPSWLLLSFQACILYLRLEAKVQIGYSAPFGQTTTLRSARAVRRKVKELNSYTPQRLPERLNSQLPRSDNLAFIHLLTSFGY